MTGMKHRKPTKTHNARVSKTTPLPTLMPTSTQVLKPVPESTTSRVRETVVTAILTVLILVSIGALVFMAKKDEIVNSMLNKTTTSEATATTTPIAGNTTLSPQEPGLSQDIDTKEDPTNRAAKFIALIIVAFFALVGIFWFVIHLILNHTTEDGQLPINRGPLRYLQVHQLERYLKHTTEVLLSAAPGVAAILLGTLLISTNLGVSGNLLIGVGSLLIFLFTGVRFVVRNWQKTSFIGRSILFAVPLMLMVGVGYAFSRGGQEYVASTLYLTALVWIVFITGFIYIIHFIPIKGTHEGGARRMYEIDRKGTYVKVAIVADLLFRRGKVREAFEALNYMYFTGIKTQQGGAPSRPTEEDSEGWGEWVGRGVDGLFERGYDATQGALERLQGYVAPVSTEESAGVSFGDRFSAFLYGQSPSEEPADSGGK